MRFARTLARTFCTLLLLIFGVYAVIGLMIAGYILYGVLVPGEEMYLDATTPSLVKVLVGTAVCVAMAAGLAWARQKLMPVMGVHRSPGQVP